MNRKIVGATVGTTISPQKLAQIIKPVTSEELDKHKIAKDAHKDIREQVQGLADALEDINGIAAPIAGFFTLGVDEDGNLFAYCEDEAVPVFEYDADTGNLYVVQEVS